jgi:hypothetical protein
MVLMCVIEREKLEDVALAFWFNMFSLSKWTATHFAGFLAQFEQCLKLCRHTEP